MQILLVLISSMLLCGQLQAQGTMTFFFNGQVRSILPNSTFFSDVKVGTPISGSFVIDYAPTDSNPGHSQQGVYYSPLVAFAGTLGTHQFSSIPSPDNLVVVNAGERSPGVDMLVIRTVPDPSLNAQQLQVNFYGPLGKIFTNDGLPTSIALFNSFSAADLIVERQGGGNIGWYTFDFIVVPEVRPLWLFAFCSAGVLLIRIGGKRGLT